MPQALRHTLLSVRDLLVTAGPFILIALLLTYVLFGFLEAIFTWPRRRREKRQARQGEQG